MKTKNEAFSLFCDGKVFYRLQEMKEPSDEVVMIIKRLVTKKLIASPIIVSVAERSAFLLPWVWLCYNPQSPLNECGPLFFAELLSFFTKFEKRVPGECYLTVAEVSIALQVAHRDWHEKH